MGFSALVSFYKEIEAAALAWPHTDICAPLEEDLSQVAMPSWTKKSLMLFFAGFCHNIFYFYPLKPFLIRCFRTAPKGGVAESGGTNGIM